MFSAAQLRAARGLLDWTRADLAKAANVSPETVKNIEHGTFRPQESTTDSIIKAFAAYDVEFTESEGVRRRSDIVTVLTGDDCYLRTLLHIEHVMRDAPGEILFMYLDRTLVGVETLEVEQRLRQNGCSFRSLVTDTVTSAKNAGDEYRCISSEYADQDLNIIYADRVATLTNLGQNMVILRNAAIADVLRRSFELIWQHSKKTAESSAA